MALPNPGSLWKYAKYIVRAAEYAVPAGLAWLESELTGNEQVADPHWMRWVVEWTRTTPAGTTEDRAQFGVNLVNITGGSVDSTWTAGDFTTVKNAFDTYLSAIKAQSGSANTFVRYKAYHMAFDPNDPGPAARKGSGLSAFAETGSPVYQLDFSTPCTGTNNSGPQQVTATTTLRTAWPRHWGRMYLPTPQGTALDGSLRWTAAYRNAVANAAFALFSTLGDAEFLAVVPVTQLERQTFHALLGVTQVVVDDVPDVQRRRRAKQVAARSIGA